MSSSQPLTTGQVAKYCRVSSVAVWKWIKQGKLRAYRLPGGHYRIERGALKEFLREHNMPIDPEFFAVSRQRILVVDDEPATVEVVARALQRLGNDIDVATASDGFEAGMQLATFKPDLLVLDLMMPQIDGFEVCRAVRQNAATAHIKILIITAYGVHENIERAIQAGANDFVHKPLDMDQLLGKVREMLAA
ncbi:MAG: response regulator [Chloroflexi bacterium]|jgi:excisionase family DNA binding protein|nr:response regulator [Chloroflexota bacterium]